MKKWIVFIFIMTILSLYFLGDTNLIKNYIYELRSQIGPWAIAVITLLYALFLSIPFVAGVEIGICLMFLFGTPGILAAYLGTIMGLSIAYCLGRSKLLRSTNNLEAHTILKEFKGFSYFIPSWLSLGLLLNFPGNSIIGGGGGIAMVYGFENKINYIQFLLIISLATMPIPLLMLYKIV